MNFDDDIGSILAAIGGTDRPLGSGAAVALTLSLGIECLALQLSVTTRSADSSPHAAYHELLREELQRWRDVTRTAFTDDARYVGAVIEARRQRDAAPATERLTHLNAELEAMQRANAVLLRLIDVSLEIEHHADLMFRGRGAAHVRSEGATARHLAVASTRALASMLVANVHTGRARAERYATAAMDLTAIREILPRITDVSARERLGAAVNDRTAPHRRRT